jgi:hypothetical protein
MLHFKSRVVADSRKISVKDRDWTLQITKVQTHDGRTMFLLQPVQERFIQLSSAFLYDEIRPAIWLTPREFSVLARALRKLGEKELEEDSGNSDEAEQS